MTPKLRLLLDDCQVRIRVIRQAAGRMKADYHADQLAAGEDALETIRADLEATLDELLRSPMQQSLPFPRSGQDGEQ